MASFGRRPQSGVKENDMVFQRLLASGVVFFGAVCAQACDAVDTRVGENPLPDAQDPLYPACQIADPTFGACIVEDDTTPYRPFVSTKATVTRIGPQTFEGASQCVPAPSAVQTTVRASNGDSWRILSKVLGQPDDLLKVGDEIDLTLKLEERDQVYVQTALIARDGELVWFMSLSDLWPHSLLAPYGMELEAGEPYCEVQEAGGGLFNSIWITSQGERVELRHGETGQAGDMTVLFGSYHTESHYPPSVYTTIAGFRSASPPGG
jgi:hypothetical protein